MTAYVVAWLIAATAAYTVRIALRRHLSPRQRHLRATRRNGTILTRPRGTTQS